MGSLWERCENPFQKCSGKKKSIIKHKRVRMQALFFMSLTHLRLSVVPNEDKDKDFNFNQPTGSLQPFT